MVVQLAFGNDHVFPGVKEVIIDSDTNRHIRIFCRALISTRFAPAYSVQLGFVAAGEKPVDSSHNININFFHGKFAGSRSFKILILWPRTMIFSSS